MHRGRSRCRLDARMAGVTHTPETADVPEPESGQFPERVGPILFFRSCEADRLGLAALLVRPVGESPPVVTDGTRRIEPETLDRRRNRIVLCYEFSIPATGGVYTVDGETFKVAGIHGGDLRIAYVSCNGQERGDDSRRLTERNAMWRRLAQQHEERPLNLLLQGGDQLYADEALDVHPDVRDWANWKTPDRDSRPPLDIVGERLRDFFFERYLNLYRQPVPARVYACVPSLCMWDDHDICDGWGSLAVERLDHPIGKEVFRAAREAFLLFQLGGTAERLPDICRDRQGTTLTWSAQLPGVLLVAPDLRSERRPDRVMGPAGWTAFEASLAGDGETRHIFILSSVPLLGPRLSWVEAAMHLLPRIQKYEDDLRDQWQSHAHRDEWQRMLRTLIDRHERAPPVTVLSGEIHLATRGTMATRRGPLHQLTASGIAHPPPTPWYGRILGALARLGAAPLPAHPIRLHPLPGRRGIYVSQRNFLILARRSGRWSAVWELEDTGATLPLPLSDIGDSGRQ